MTVSDVASLLPGSAAIIASIVAAIGIRSYGVATAAEERLKDSATIENEVKVSQLVSTLMQRAEAWGEVHDGKPTPVGLASQLTAIHSIVRLAQLYPKISYSCLPGLKILLATESMKPVHADLDSAIEGLEEAARRRLAK